MIIIGQNSVKSKARNYYKLNPSVTIEELQAIFSDVLPTTIHKYLIEFRQLFGVKKENVPDEISVSKLEKELSLQLERNPTSAVIKSCIDFLKLKQTTDGQVDELDMDKFFKMGKELDGTE